MKLRKANAVFSIISTILLLMHAISLAAWMLSLGNIPMVGGPLPYVLIAFFLVHAILSIILMASVHKGSKGIKGRKYAKLNAATIIQRITGVLLIPLTALHILGAAGITHTPPTVHAIVPPLFFAVVLVHVALSASKAFITLGIGNAKFIKFADISIKALCAVTLFADIVGFYLFVC